MYIQISWTMDQHMKYQADVCEFQPIWEVEIKQKRWPCYIESWDSVNTKYSRSCTVHLYSNEKDRFKVQVYL